MTRKLEQWEIELRQEVKAAKKSKTCLECGREKVIGEQFCDMCAEEAHYLMNDFLKYEAPYLKEGKR